MSATEGVIVLDSENSVAVDKINIERRSNDSFGSAARKKLGDISNLPQRAKPSNQDEKSQFISAVTKEYIDQLHKENLALTKLLADRNKILELSGIELQKLRVNLCKLQQQNLQLAQANSQMLVELNSGKDKRKMLQHELGCKNGLLIAKQLEEKEKTRTCKKIDHEAGMIHCKDSSQAVGYNNKQCNTNRKQKSKSQSMGPSTMKEVRAEEKAENKRLCSRRKSTRFKADEAEPTGDLFLADDANFPACFHDDQMHEGGSSSMFSSDGDNNKPCNTNRKQKSKSLGPSSMKQAQASEKAEKKRICSRRQSARFKSEEAEPTEDLFLVDDANFPACLHDDQMQEGGSNSTCSSVEKDDREGNTATRDEAQEFRRSSVGRPLRLASMKIQSYKEMALNVKMRRTE